MMSTDQNKLPAEVLAALYGNKLYELPGDQAFAAPPAPAAQEQAVPVSPAPVPAPAPAPAPPLTDTAPPAAYKFLGNHHKKVSILVNFPQDAFLPETHLQFLAKILAACQMNLGDIAIVNHGAAPVAIDQLKTQLQPVKILLFGVSPGDIGLPLNFPHFKLQAYAGCQYLAAPGLEAMNDATQDSKLLKSKLWLCLKEMFNV